jgi:hypothetical protein
MVDFRFITLEKGARLGDNRETEFQMLEDERRNPFATTDRKPSFDHARQETPDHDQLISSRSLQV